MTINVCIGGDFTTGGQILFDAGQTSYQHKPGFGLIHSGDTRHAVAGCNGGSRWNLLYFVKRNAAAAGGGAAASVVSAQ